MSVSKVTHALIASALFAGSGAVAQPADPLAVIDWLTQPPVTIAPAPKPDNTPVAEPIPDEPPVTTGAAQPDVRVTPLGEASPDGAGLLSPAVTGFPLDLWRGTSQDTLSLLFTALDTSPSPAMQRLMMQLMLAEADPPLGLSGPGDFLAMRANRLASVGAVDQALALLERAGTDTPALFEVYFDLALLTDQTDVACEQLAAQPYLSREYGPRIFCLARAGDWQAAATTRDSAALLGAISETDADLLALFLDPELAEESAPPALPRRPSPLEVRLFAALGQPIPPTDLPPGHSVRDLSGDSGWKAQIEAAERLTALGAIDPARLFGIYALRRPSASGGVWERAKVIQQLERALDEERDAAAGAALLRALPMMREQRLDGGFATYFAPRLLNAGLSGAARDAGISVSLLSGLYETAAAGLATDERPFDAALAGGDVAAMTQHARTDVERAIAQGFSTRDLPPALEVLRQDDKLGELILRAMALYLAGQTGDLREASDSIATFRAVGLEDIARRIGFELRLLDRGA